VRKFGEELGGDTPPMCFLFSYFSPTFYYFLSFDSSFHMYQRRRENVRSKIWPKEEREKVIKRNGKGDMWEWIGEKVER
jgi:hypothetical protein